MEFLPNLDMKLDRDCLASYWQWKVLPLWLWLFSWVVLRFKRFLLMSKKTTSISDYGPKSSGNSSMAASFKFYLDTAKITYRSFVFYCCSLYLQRRKKCHAISSAFKMSTALLYFNSSKFPTILCHVSCVMCHVSCNRKHMTSKSNCWELSANAEESSL